MQQSQSTYSYSVMYIMVYRHVHSELIYEFIKPFTVNDRLFQKLLETVIFVDTESNVPFTQIMNAEFSKITSSPAMIRVVGGDIVTDANIIAEIMNTVYNDCIDMLNNNLDIPFDNSTCMRDDHYITEQMYNPSNMNVTNEKYIQNYAAQYTQDNLNRQGFFPKRPVCDGPVCTQIRDTPIKNLSISTTDTDIAKANLSSMQLTYPK